MLKSIFAVFAAAGFLCGLASSLQAQVEDIAKSGKSEICKPPQGQNFTPKNKRSVCMISADL